MIAVFDLFQCPGELVRTGGWFETTADSLQLTDGIINLHTFYKVGNSLKISVAAAIELYKFNNSVLYLYINRSGTGSFCLIFHNKYHLSDKVLYPMICNF